MIQACDPINLRLGAAHYVNAKNALTFYRIVTKLYMYICEGNIWTCPNMAPKYGTKTLKNVSYNKGSIKNDQKNV